MLDETAYRNGQPNALRTDGSPEQAAEDYVHTTHPGADVTASASGDTVTVTEKFEQRLNILGTALGTVTVDGQGSARTAHGITQENG